MIDLQTWLVQVTQVDGCDRGGARMKKIVGKEVKIMCETACFSTLKYVYSTHSHNCDILTGTKHLALFVQLAEDGWQIASQKLV